MTHEADKKLIAFVDFRKAYDSVDMKTLIKVLKEIGTQN